MAPFSIVVLAAGLGSRLGRPSPKPLTVLHDGRSIMQQQMDNLAEIFPEVPVHVVVGFKKELIMERFPDSIYVYNPEYDQTNTSKSLLRAIRRVPAGGVLWLNGDVVFDAQLLVELKPLIDGDESAICVNHASVGEEEVKYTVDDAGFVRELSKTVVGGLGEAVGINYVASHDRPLLMRHLESCSEHDYFERAIETAIAEDALRVRPVDISDFACVEVDFQVDLERANHLF